MYGILFEKYKFRWCDYFNKMIYFYDCMKNDFIGYMFFCLFNRNLCFLMDLMFDFKFFVFGF